MKKSIVVAAALVIGGVSLPHTALGADSKTNLAPLVSASSGGVSGEYIVAVRDGRNPSDVARELGVTPSYVYDGAFRGFAMKVDSGKLSLVRSATGSVLSVTQNRSMRLPQEQEERSFVSTQNSPTWGLDRIDQRYLPLDSKYRYEQKAGNVRAYVIDSGIDTDHPDFGGRVLNMYSASGGSGNDCEGHGTHVAGTIGSSTYGVAKSVQLRSVKVTTGCTDEMTTAALLAGIDWVYKNAIMPAVVNISVISNFDINLNNATTSLVNKGLFVAASAGNRGEFSCAVSPASALGVTGVAASNSQDQHVNDQMQSAYGPCIDIYAPGRSIRSTVPNSPSDPNAWESRSGTSMASPHVAGVAAILKAKYPGYTPQNIQDWIVGNGTRNVLSNVPWGTPNILLHKGSI